MDPVPGGRGDRSLAGDLDVADLRHQHSVSSTFKSARGKLLMSGPVAQLGARFHGMEEVDGSNPSRSTKPSKLTSPRDSSASSGLFLRLRMRDRR